MAALTPPRGLGAGQRLGARGPRLSPWRETVGGRQSDGGDNADRWKWWIEAAMLVGGCGCGMRWPRRRVGAAVGGGDGGWRRRVETANGGGTASG